MGIYCLCSCMILIGHVKSSAGNIWKVGNRGDMGNNVSLRKMLKIKKLDSTG